VRLFLVAVMVLVPAVVSASKNALAERAVDYTWVRGAAAFDNGDYGDEREGAVVPAHPSLFVHVGSDGPGMPRFTTARGVPIDVALVTQLQGGEWLSLYRVDLDIDEGTIQVWLGDADEPVRRYLVNPRFEPRTRSVEIRPSGGSLWVDSDAVAFRVENGPVTRIWLSDGPHIPLDEGVRQRVVALYSNGTESTIFDGVPIAHADQTVGVRVDRVGVSRLPGFRIVPVLIAWLALGLFALVRRKTMPAE